MKRMFFGVVLVLAGCGQSIPLEDWCQAQASASCRRGLRCGTVASGYDCDKASDTVSAPECLGINAPALANGTMRYDGYAAAECLDSIEASDCVWSTEPLPGCDRVIAATATRGESCGLCAPGFHCVGDGTSSCGTCTESPPVEYPSEGQACMSPLNDGLGCKSGLTCWNSVCVKPVAQGGNCADAPCETGLCRDGICVPQPDDGDACQGPFECREPLRCSDGVCVKRLALAAACSSSDECESRSCFEGVCVGRRALGMSCGAGARCESNLFCESGSCAAQPRNGESCTETTGCASYGQCLNGTCFDPLLECR